MAKLCFKYVNAEYIHVADGGIWVEHNSGIDPSHPHVLHYFDEGQEVEIVLPAKHDVDFNEVLLMAEGKLKMAPNIFVVDDESNRNIGAREFVMAKRKANRNVRFTVHYTLERFPGCKGSTNVIKDDFSNASIEHLLWEILYKPEYYRVINIIAKD